MNRCSDCGEQYFNNHVCDAKIRKHSPVKRVVMPRCFLCESLKIESRTPLMKATKEVFVCYDCVDVMYEVMTAEKKGESLNLPNGPNG